MACAKKCDRCGKLYEEYNIEDDKKNPNGIMVLNLDSQRRYFTHNVMDLCPDCMKEFQDWLREVKQMERLTERYKDPIANTVLIKECGDKLCKNICDDIEYDCSKCGLEKALEKLADYEDLEECGLLMRLPCKIGDDVYIIPSPTVYRLNIINGYEKLNKICHQHVGTIVITAGHWYATSREEYGVYNEKVLNDIAFGTTWFLTREEAEKKLEEMKNE